MLSETPPTTRSTSSPARQVLQQVIFGYTGLRLGDGGLEPAFPPVLPSRITRLVLPERAGARRPLRRDRGQQRAADRAARGRSRTMSLTLGLALLVQAAAQAAMRAPVLAFPEPGLDDTAAYQGYATRFYRDSRDNSVQVYLERALRPGGQPVGRRRQREPGLPARDGQGRLAAMRVGCGLGGGVGFGRRAHGGIPAGGVGIRDAGLVRAWLHAGGAGLPVREAAPRAVHRPALHVAEESLLVANVDGSRRRSGAAPGAAARGERGGPRAAAPALVLPAPAGTASGAFAWSARRSTA